MTDDVWQRRRTSFGSQAEAYATGRPAYPRDALMWILPDGARRVLDLGAGTGILTRGVLDLGVDVVAVEPLEDMRAHVPADAQVLDGTAEDIPLDDASVDAVVAGQAFHWFDATRAVDEIARVLRPGGRLGLLWNLLDDDDALTSALADVLHEDARTRNMRADRQPPYSGVTTMTTPERAAFAHAQTYDANRLVAFVHSRSQTILLPDGERSRLVDAVRDLAPDGAFPVRFVCEVWRGERLG